MFEVEIIMMFYKYKVTKANLQVGNNGLLINTEIMKGEVEAVMQTHTSIYGGYMAVNSNI